MATTPPIFSAGSFVPSTSPASLTRRSTAPRPLQRSRVRRGGGSEPVGGRPRPLPEVALDRRFAAGPPALLPGPSTAQARLPVQPGHLIGEERSKPSGAEIAQ